MKASWRERVGLTLFLVSISSLVGVVFYPMVLELWNLNPNLLCLTVVLLIMMVSGLMLMFWDAGR